MIIYTRELILSPGRENRQVKVAGGTLESKRENAFKHMEAEVKQNRLQGFIYLAGWFGHGLFTSAGKYWKHESRSLC